MHAQKREPHDQRISLSSPGALQCSPPAAGAHAMQNCNAMWGNLPAQHRKAIGLPLAAGKEKKQTGPLQEACHGTKAFCLS